MAVLRRHRGALHLLITDVVLPGRDGLQLAASIADRHPEARTLFISGYGDAAHLPPAIAESDGRLLRKPFTGSALARQARAVLDGSRAVDAGPRVLFVDDDVDVRHVAHALLAAEGMTVVTARDGDQALAILETVPCDVVVCDMFMPNKEGIETCTEVRRLYPDLPFIAMSGAAGGEDVLRTAVKLGAVASLNKPFGGRDLVRVVTDALLTTA
jgi:DNA-binding NtrC family response regulator